MAIRYRRPRLDAVLPNVHENIGMIHVALRRAFLKLDPNYSGFVPTSDADYGVVRKLIKPFETSNPG